MNFALIGAAGYVAPRHMKAIYETGNRLVAAADPHDAVGILDRYGFDVRYFPEIERFDRFLDKRRRGPEEDRIHYVSICSPNYLHDAHIRMALRNGAHAICEKPLVINPWNLDALERIEEESSRRIWTVLQLRVHPQLMELQARLVQSKPSQKHQVILTYVTSRGPWYHASWKGSEERSGGVATNIGIHLFDLLIWLFGGVQEVQVQRRDPKRMAGHLGLKRAEVQWFLSVDQEDLPASAISDGRTTYRHISVDGQEVEFTNGFADLHTRVYELTLTGKGFGVTDARPSIELVYTLRHAPLIGGEGVRHPL